MTQPDADVVRRKVKARIAQGVKKSKIARDADIARNSLYAFLDGSTDSEERTVGKLDAWLRGVPYGAPADLERAAVEIAARRLRRLANELEAEITSADKDEEAVRTEEALPDDRGPPGDGTGETEVA